MSNKGPKLEYKIPWDEKEKLKKTLRWTDKCGRKLRLKKWDKKEKAIKPLNIPPKKQEERLEME